MEDTERQQQIVEIFEEQDSLAPIPEDYLEREFIVLLNDWAQGSRLLDVACGNGFISLEVARRAPGVHVVGFDLTPRLIQEATEEATQEGLTNAHFFVGDAENLTIAGSFDIVLCRFAAHFFKDVPSFLRECVRLLSPGGRLTLSVAAAPSAPMLYDLVNALFEQIIPAFVHFHSEAQFLDMIQQAGLSLEWVLRRRVWEFDQEDMRQAWKKILSKRGHCANDYLFDDALPFVLIITARKAS